MRWHGDSLELLDQTKLPKTLEYIHCQDYRRVGLAIKRLEVRGAPAIGAAAAYGVVLGAQEVVGESDFRAKVTVIADELRQTRPTAVNLFWAIDRMMAALDKCDADMTNEAITAKLEEEAKVVEELDREVNRSMSEHGATLFTEPVSILTHCNAGALATVAYGTALGVIRQAHAEGNVVRVFADETRPLLQGARLTAWELNEDGIPVTLITDNMAGWVMKQKKVQAVIVGADRITSNGDVANKIGTYSVAVLAKEHGIPFYVAAPMSTFDWTLASGEEIPIEERDADEVKHVYGVQTAPLDIDVFNPAFDVTPHEYVAAIITEKGIIHNPNEETMARFKKEKM
ncbi:MAG: S-methyl-5-thioribose-1-phosphate isomerase [Selenomonadales bacterium]|nr:S-methyl-5-thioribose-1-phosphate isomerase [Selenomonadales bacterium]